MAEEKSGLLIAAIVAIVAIVGLVILFQSSNGVTGAAVLDDDDEFCNAGFSCIVGDDDRPCPPGLICERECDDDDDDGQPDCELKECEMNGIDDGDDSDDGICAKKSAVPCSAFGFGGTCAELGACPAGGFLAGPPAPGGECGATEGCCISP